MLLLKNHKAMTLIYHRKKGDNILGFFSLLVKSEQNGFTLGYKSLYTKSMFSIVFL
jgi:hypothetical protein